jgi:hypothetical protein
VLFVLSIGLAAFNCLKGGPSDVVADLHHYQFIQKHAVNADGPLQQVSEKNETETESETDIDLQPIILPFLSSSFVTEPKGLHLSQQISVPLPAPSQPIYIGICNFRV